MSYDPSDFLSSTSTTRTKIQTANGEFIPITQAGDDAQTGRIIGRGIERGGLYYVNEVTQQGNTLLAQGSPEYQIWMWHRRLEMMDHDPPTQVSNTADVNSETSVSAPSHQSTPMTTTEHPESTSVEYILDLLTETGMLGSKPADTPIVANHGLQVIEGAKATDKEQYQKIVGKLIYLAHTRPDIAYAVGIVSRFMHLPQIHHMTAVMRILRYLKGTSSTGIYFRKNDSLDIIAYTDADWAGDRDERKSTSGYFTLVGGNLVTWRSKKQKVVALSSAEAEFREIVKGITEILWIRKLLNELDFKVLAQFFHQHPSISWIKMQMFLKSQIAKSSMLGTQKRNATGCTVFPKISNSLREGILDQQQLLTTIVKHHWNMLMKLKA
uniref:Reverse transcriptase Ty1/copia-type domain-containing protein n=1 Tax=Solanum lycopersicum TaxID=4081 RepID=A0A3Q7I3F4_SOLLC